MKLPTLRSACPSSESRNGLGRRIPRIIYALLIGFLVIGNSNTSAAMRITNTRLATTDFLSSDSGTVAAVVDEIRVDADLNGDLFTDSLVVHVVNAVTGTITNTRLAIERGFDSIKTRQSLVAILVSEAWQRADLNGDGAHDDYVVHIFNASAGTTVNTRLASCLRSDCFQLAGNGKVAVLVLESRQGGDLNGDGDSEDAVLHIFDTSTNTAINTGLASNLSIAFASDEGVVAFAVAEQNQGMSDLNGDGDMLDDVLHVFRDGVTTNTGFQVNGFTKPERGLVAFEVEERKQGVDLNGDGEIGDFCLYTYDSVTRTANFINAGFLRKGLKDGFVVHEAFEFTSQQLFKKLILAFNTVTGTIASSGTVGPGLSPLIFAVGEPNGGFIPFVVQERRDSNFSPGVDVNGDGDDRDFVLHVMNLASGAVLNTRLVLGRVQVIPFVNEDGLLTFPVPESLAEEDLNGDGDQSDGVIHAVDAATGTVRNSQLGVSSAPTLYPHEGKVAFPVPEFQDVFNPQAGGIDLNGDSDTLDRVMHVFDTVTGAITNTGITYYSFKLELDKPDDGLLPFLVRERDQGDTDLTGDGSADDWVVHAVDASTGSVINTGLSTFDLDLLSVDGFVAFRVPEEDIGDLNGDGDRTDRVLHVVEFSVDARDAADLIAIDVSALADAGVLNKGQAKGLTNKLVSFKKKIDEGNINAARAKLMEFIIQIANFIDDGVLNQSEGQPLIDAARTILDTL